MRILSSAFKKKKEDPSLFQQQGSNYCLEPMKTHHDLDLKFFNSEHVFTTMLLTFS